MILVDIYVPVLDEIYDFHLDEHTEIGILIEEAAEMICQKEQCPLKGSAEDLSLWKLDSRYLLSRRNTLAEAGVTAGDKLLLV